MGPCHRSVRGMNIPCGGDDPVNKGESGEGGDKRYATEVMMP